MSTFDVQSIEIAAPFSAAFRYIADPANLPEWTHAFKHVSEDHATMETPAGADQSPAPFTPNAPEHPRFR